MNLAEAKVRSTGTVDAQSIALLNAIRGRSDASTVFKAADFTNADALADAIVNERRIEFLMEGRRWSDIHRLQGDDLHPIDGIPGKIKNGGLGTADAFTLGTPYTGALAVAAIPGSDKRFLWPIPLEETNNNPTLKAEQNPGW